MLSVTVVHPHLTKFRGHAELQAIPDSLVHVVGTFYYLTVVIVKC